MRVLPCAQGTPDWLDARLGLATASNFKRIMTPTTMKLSTQALDYACQLIAERLTGGPDPWASEPYENADMRRGTYTEAEARKWYQLERDVDVECVGLCIHENERWGASPDGLIGDDGGLELKCPAPKTQVRWLTDGVVPAEHLPQIHGALIVTGRQYWDFMSYAVGLPPLLIRIEPSDYTATLRGFLEQFNGMYDDLLAKIEARLQRHIDDVIDRQQVETHKELLSFL